MVRLYFTPAVGTNPVWPLFVVFLPAALITHSIKCYTYLTRITLPINFPFLSPPMFSGATSVFQNVYFPIIASDNQPTGPSKILLTFLPVPLYFLARTSSHPCANAMIKFPYNCRECWIHKSPSYKQNLNFSPSRAPLALCLLLTHSASLRQPLNYT